MLNEEHAICFGLRAPSFGFQRRSRRMGVRFQVSEVSDREIDNRKSFLLLATDLTPLDGVVQAEVN